MTRAGDILNVARDIMKASRVDGVWELELSCGHTQRWEGLVPPARPSCAECLKKFAERMSDHKGGE